MHKNITTVVKQRPANKAVNRSLTVKAVKQSHPNRDDRKPAPDPQIE